MANQEHLAILQQGVEVWNQWRQKNPKVRPDLSRVNLIGANLRRAILTRADLKGAILTRADLRGAILIRADLRKADLRFASLEFTNLNGADIREAKLIWVKLSEANLRRAKLSEAKLYGVNLYKANLRETNLSGADLSRTQALRANFNGATFTGACIEDWTISYETNLDNVICDYIYLKRDKQERRPASGNFTPREFEKLIAIVPSTVDLIFSDGIDWQAFLTSFQKLQVECGGSELAIQAIERKSGGAFVVRVEVPADANKATVEQYLKREYEIQLKAIEEKYRLQLNAKDEQIEIYKQNSANIMKMAELVAKVSNPTIVNVEAKAVAESESKGDIYNQSGNIGIGHMSGGEIQKGAKVAGVINEAEQQNLAQAAAEIQQLLEQLSQTNPTTTNKEKMVVVAEAVDQIESNPTLKARVINALKAGGTEAFKEAIDHPLINILMATIEGWQEAE